MRGCSGSCTGIRRGRCCEGGLKGSGEDLVEGEEDWEEPKRSPLLRMVENVESSVEEEEEVVVVGEIVYGQILASAEDPSGQSLAETGPGLEARVVVLVGGCT